jgi:hypothetical protein
MITTPLIPLYQRLNRKAKVHDFSLPARRQGACVYL